MDTSPSIPFTIPFGCRPGNRTDPPSFPEKMRNVYRGVTPAVMPEATCCLLGWLGGEGVSKGVGLTWAEAGAFH